MLYPETLKCLYAAAANGAVPVPAASAAIVGENAVMIIGHIANAMVGIAEAVKSIGTVGVVNQVGRALFIEVGKFLSWGTGGLTMPLLMDAGATTAGL